MKTYLFLLSLIILVTSCSSMQKRTPASVEEEKEESHQKFQGLFDKQY